jgi:hypothetical protein
MSLLHKCHVPACVNPTHLYVGTQAENNRDTQHMGRLYEISVVGRTLVHGPDGRFVPREALG